MHGFNIVSQRNITFYDSSCHIYFNGPDSKRVLYASTLKYNDADKHDTPPSHFIPTPG